MMMMIINELDRLALQDHGSSVFKSCLGQPQIGPGPGASRATATADGARTMLGPERAEPEWPPAPCLPWAGGTGT